MEQENERIINFGWALWFDSDTEIIFNAQNDERLREKIGKGKIDKLKTTKQINNLYKKNIDWDAITKSELKIEDLYREILKETFGISYSSSEGHDSDDALVGSCGAPLSVVIEKIKNGKGEYSGHHNDSDRYIYNTDSGSLQSDIINKYLHPYDSCYVEFFAFEDEIEAAKGQNKEKVA